MSLSRSNQPLKELFTGVHLVAITDAKPLDNSILVRFSDGHNKSFDKIYSMDSEFIKMCGDAGTISETSVFDDTHAIGKRLWIAIKEVWIDAETVNFYLFDTFPYVEGFNEPPEVKKGLFREEMFKVISAEDARRNGIPLDFSNAKPFPHSKNIEDITIKDWIKPSNLGIVEKTSKSEDKVLSVKYERIPKPSEEKAKTIAEQRAMIAKVEAKKPDDEFEM